MRARILVPGLVLIGLAFLGSARAEVSAKLSDSGEYLGMLYKYGTMYNRRIWSSAAPTMTRRPLNPTGDTLGDLAPSVAENPTMMYWPLAVWSHPNGPDYDLVFSRWTGVGWTPLQFVQADNFNDDLEPRLAFNAQGRPYMVWWSNESGIGAVYFSLFLETRWMTPVRVSPTGVDSRHADLLIESDLHVRVSYDVFESRQIRTITIPSRDTITDDIDPKIRKEIIIN